MAIQIIFTVIGCISVGFLLWCLSGFTRALQQGRGVVGLVVRVEDADAKGAAKDKIRRHTGRVLVRPRTRTQLAQFEKG